MLKDFISKSLLLILILITVILVLYIIHSFIYFCYLKIKQISICKTERAQKLNIILKFATENDFKILDNIEDYYLYFNKFNYLTFFFIDDVVLKSTKNDITYYYDKAVRHLCTKAGYFHSIECKSYRLEELFSQIKECKTYKEEMLFISWLLQVNYIYYKTDVRILSKEQLEVLSLIKNGVLNERNRAQAASKKEKNELYKAFKEENDKFNKFAKSLYTNLDNQESL